MTTGEGDGAVDPCLGKVFGGFKATARLGEGAMATVYRSERVSDGATGFVVKVLTSGKADEKIRARFVREARIMTALRHPNIVSVFASGREHDFDYMVMELVDGPNLGELLERYDRFDPARAAKSARQISFALEAAHALGVIHRDVKPQNILFAKAEGLLKVADFGVAKVTRPTETLEPPAPSDPSRTAIGDILGSPLYMAPEQWGDHDVDARADLFALGVVLYQMIAGVPPFLGKTPVDCGVKILAGDYPPLEKRVPDVPAGIREIVVGLLERVRENRYAAASRVTADLERFLRGEFPDVPRLVSQTIPPERYALLGRDQFVLGSGAGAQVRIAHPSVADGHAVLERTNVGVLLKDLEGKGTTRVNGGRIKSVVLKEGDQITVGDSLPLKFRAGSMTPPPLVAPAMGGAGEVSGSLDPARLRAVLGGATVPGLVYEALVREVGPRAVLAAAELLDDTTAQRLVDRSRARLLAAGLPDSVVEPAAERARELYSQRSRLLPDQLFRATRENLGSETVRWVEWWLSVGNQRLPAQVRRAGARETVHLTLVGSSQEEAPRQVELIEGSPWSIGRDEICEVRIGDASVSRRHATIHRLATRFAVVDEASRHGTVVRGERRTLCLLRDGDTVELGRAKVIFRQPLETDSPGRKRTLHEVDGVVFDALVEIAPQHAAAALVLLAGPERLLDGILKSAGGDEETTRLVRASLDARRRRALEVLPKLSEQDHGFKAQGWIDWWRSVRATSPVQIAPEGLAEHAVPLEG